MNTKTKLMLIIAGPTGVGKSDFAIEIGTKFPSEIINVDLGQFYKPLSIGTAKPDWQSYPIPHHFFDIIDSPKDFTVYEYRELLINKLEEIWNKNKIPILVGGSGFYIQSLLFPPHVKNESMKKNEIFDEDKDLWELLYEVDPIRAKQINKNDSYRIKRALEIWKLTGKKPSEFEPIYNPISDFFLIILTRDRKELYQRINDRVIEMINQGWIEEVKNLPKEWIEFLRKKKIIGYDDILLYLESNFNNDKDLLINAIQQKVRKYSKRQITFFKNLSQKITKAEKETSKNNAKKIDWLNLTLFDSNLYIDQLLKNISNYYSIGEL